MGIKLAPEKGRIRRGGKRKRDQIMIIKGRKDSRDSSK